MTAPGLSSLGATERPRLFGERARVPLKEPAGLNRDPGGGRGLRGRYPGSPAALGVPYFHRPLSQLGNPVRPPHNPWAGMAPGVLPSPGCLS